MKQVKTYAAATAMLATASLLATSVAGAGGLARGKVYSTAAVNKVCADAQQIVTGTDLPVNNVILSEWDAFEQSDAAPYSIVGDSPAVLYIPSEEPDLPLTSTQHVIYGLYGTGNRDFPQVVSCKMKNAEYLEEAPEFPYAMDELPDKSCKDVNEDLVDRVLASLTNPEQYQIVMEPDAEIPVEVDPDQDFPTGSAWTAGFPDNPYPVLYRTEEGGALHVQASSLYVEPHPNDPLPFPPFLDLITTCNFAIGPGNPVPPIGGFITACEPRKWGVQYCHLPGAEYIRAALTGEVEVPILGGP